jgi:Eco57I restriction-modification methylase
MKFYNNDPSCQFKSDKALKSAELKLFRDILEAQHQRIQEGIKILRRKLEEPLQRQVRLDGTLEEKPQQIGLEAMEVQKKIDAMTGDIDRISRSRAALKTTSDIPFIWDIAFVEIFEGENDGFDIVIGNPPYVRQENISEPRLSREEVTTENKKEYKAKLMRSVYQAFDRFFGYQPKNDSDPL